MKKRLGIYLLLFCTGLLLLPSCKLGRFVFYNFADIKDYKIFPARVAHTDSMQFKFYRTEQGRFPKTATDEKNRTLDFDTYLEKHKTVAFLIIKNDTVQYEKYFKNYDTASIIPSFSVGKSVLSILIGCAIDDGLITSDTDRVLKYVPYLHKGFENVTVRDLIQMTSGVYFNESYWNPFGHAASFYYGRNLHKECKKLRVKSTPATEFDYVSGNTQLLGLVLEAALKDKPITQYLQEKLWQPMQMEFDASWSLDKRKDGVEKTFCCLNARARDFAKIGRLYLNNGNWNGKQLVSKQWVQKSTAIDTTNGSAWYYQYGWWLPTKNGDFMAIGILGQYIYVNPAKNLIIVRMGKQVGGVDWRVVLPEMASHY
jgi:CubicO group peptidase (beta-lactamase class C family)